MGSQYVPPIFYPSPYARPHSYTNSNTPTLRWFRVTASILLSLLLNNPVD